MGFIVFMRTIDELCFDRFVWRPTRAVRLLKLRDLPFQLKIAIIIMQAGDHAALNSTLR